MPTTTLVRVERVGARPQISTVTLDDGKANALSFDVIDNLVAVLAEEAEVSKALVLAGRPGMFCAGLDLKVVNGGDREEFDRLLERGTELYQAMLRSPVPIVAACTGHALAGGALTLLCCDYRVGFRGPFKIGLHEVSIGVPVPAFGSQVARLRLNRARFVRATILAEVTDPDEAVTVGFLDEVTDTDVVEAAVLRADRLAPLAGRAYAVGKHIVFKDLDGRMTRG